MSFLTLPVLYWDGEEICTSTAIGRFVAKKVGMYGRGEVQVNWFRMLDFCGKLTRVSCHIFRKPGWTPFSTTSLRYSTVSVVAEYAVCCHLNYFFWVKRQVHGQNVFFVFQTTSRSASTRTRTPRGRRRRPSVTGSSQTSSRSRRRG